MCVQALLSLPVEERQDYKALVGDATLMVEQLLINKKARNSQKFNSDAASPI